MATRPTFRFAPTPNGPLHLGHALSAILNHDRARAAGGRFVVRMEDIDPTRCKPAFEAAILDDLAWLGLAWDGPVRRQSEHMDAYAAALDGLRAAGLVYPSFVTRAELAARAAAAAEAGAPWPRDPDGALLPPPEERDLPPSATAARIAAGEPYAWRLDLARALRQVPAPLVFEEMDAGPDGERGAVIARPEAWGDVVLARKETPTSYHLAVVVDDALQGVTDVVRGRDLFAATSVHRLLQALLGLPVPRYHHHRLILDARGRKLAKSSGSTALAALRAEGATPADIRRLVGLG